MPSCWTCAARVEWKDGHIPSAIHIPLGYLTDRLAEVPADRPVVVQCQAGARSAIAASVLQRAGRRNMQNLAGGFAVWQGAGLPVVTPAVMRGRTMTAELLEDVAARFKVLAEPARLQVLNALADGPLNVSALMEATGLNQANLSKHLQMLHAHGFVSRRRDGLFVYYDLADDSVFTLCDLACGAVEERARQAARRHGTGRRQ